MAASPTSRRAVLFGFGLMSAPAVLSTAVNDAFAQTKGCVTPSQAAARIEALGEERMSVVAMAILKAAADVYGIDRSAEDLKPVLDEMRRRDPTAHDSLRNFHSQLGPKTYAFQVRTNSMFGAFDEALQSPQVAVLEGVKFSLAKAYPLIREPEAAKRSAAVGPRHDGPVVAPK